MLPALLHNACVAVRVAREAEAAEAQARADARSSKFAISSIARRLDRAAENALRLEALERRSRAPETTVAAPVEPAAVTAVPPVATAHPPLPSSTLPLGVRLAGDLLAANEESELLDTLARHLQRVSTLREAVKMDTEKEAVKRLLALPQATHVLEQLGHAWVR